ncbi:MAG: hypothetical protein M3Z98_03550, partial [Candidatus Dormibacteraeota bacterium]|nr:hypothetical protein [Candidatus Dormibacteraeota bacterium]
PRAGRIWITKSLVAGPEASVLTMTRVHKKVHEYEVFARKARIDPLRHVGRVVAPDDDIAQAYARATYDEERWVEMIIVPREAVITVTAPGEE